MKQQYDKDGAYILEHGWRAVVQRVTSDSVGHKWKAHIERIPDQKIASERLFVSRSEARQWCESAFIDEQVRVNTSVSKHQLTCNLCGKHIITKEKYRHFIQVHPEVIGSNVQWPKSFARKKRSSPKEVRRDALDRAILGSGFETNRRKH